MFNFDLQVTVVASGKEIWNKAWGNSFLSSVGKVLAYLTLSRST